MFNRLGCARSLAAALAALLACGSAALAQNDAPVSPPLPVGTTACSGFAAFATDADPNGLNVRAEPDAHAKILGRLPPPKVWNGGYAWYAVTKVVGYKNGWFLIEHSDASDMVDDKTGKSAAKFAPYAGRGWVSANLLTAQLGSPVVEAPNGDSSKVVQLDSYQDTKTHRILSCVGPWLHVEIALPKGVAALVKTDAPPGFVRGWVDGTCGNQRTTCDFGGKTWSPPAPTPLPAE